MKTLTTTSWKRRGSSVIFALAEIQELLREHAMVSLREFLSWRQSVPEEPPIPGDTILVSGLEAILDTLPPAEAEEFLRTKVRPVIKSVNNVWTETGIVFGFADYRRFEETSGMNEEVFMLRSDGEKIRLSEGLWDGTAALNMLRIETTFIGEPQTVRVGYHVQRIS